MAKIAFTKNIQRHVECAEAELVGDTVAQVLDAFFQQNEKARGYVLDEQKALRQHMVIFVDGEVVKDRVKLSDAVRADSEIYIMQALSGG